MAVVLFSVVVAGGRRVSVTVPVVFGRFQLFAADGSAVPVSWLMSVG